MGQMSSDQWNSVYSIGNKYGIDNSTLYAIIMNESGGDTNSNLKTSQEDSRGIFQVNTYAHPDANSTALYDPVYSANYWIPTLAQTYQQGKAKGLSGVELAQYTERYGERPAWNSSIAANIAKYYNNSGTSSTAPSATITSSNSSGSSKPSWLGGIVTDILTPIIKLGVYGGIIVGVFFALKTTFEINNK